MGNCQAIDAAVLVIQHPAGKIDRLYCPIIARDVMNMNPGHYVSLIIPLPVPDQTTEERRNDKPVQFTQVKLLRPNETLALGHAYRLITTQDVMKVLKAKKYAKMKHRSSAEKIGVAEEDKTTVTKGFLDLKSSEYNNQELQSIRRHKRRSGSKSWQPTLDSITEGGL